MTAREAITRTHDLLQWGTFLHADEEIKDATMDYPSWTGNGTLPDGRPFTIVITPGETPDDYWKGKRTQFWHGSIFGASLAILIIAAATLTTLAIR